MPINNKAVHNRLIKPIKLQRRRGVTKAVARPIPGPRPVPVTRMPKSALPTLNKRLKIGKSVRRQLVSKVAEIAVRGAPSVIEDKINKLKNSRVGNILVIIGNGPSFKKAPLGKLKGYDQIDIMCINKPDDRVWPSDYWMFCDNSQYRRHIKLWNSYKGTIINASSVTRTRKNAIRIKSLSGKGFSKNLLRGFHIGRSSTYAAMQLALWMGYDEIYIFGVDMCAVDGKLYPWGSNPDVKDNTRKKRFKLEADYYDRAAKEMTEKVRKKFYFCSKYNPFPFVKKYNKLDETKAPGIILEKIKKKTGDTNGG
jgi:hypothetical protein